MSQASSGFDVEVASHPAGLTLSVSGDLDLGTSPILGLRVAQLRADRGADLIVDLSGCDFCDSAGVSALIALRKRCDQEGWRLKIVHAQLAVRRMLVDFTGVGDYLNVV